MQHPNIVLPKSVGLTAYLPAQPAGEGNQAISSLQLRHLQHTGAPPLCSSVPHSHRRGRQNKKLSGKNTVAPALLELGCVEMKTSLTVT